MLKMLQEHHPALVSEAVVIDRDGLFAGLVLRLRARVSVGLVCRHFEIF